MFSRRRSLFDFSRSRLTKAPRRQKRRSRKLTDLGGGYHTRLGVEQLEDRRMLAVDVFIDPVTDLVTIMDESGLGEISEVQEDNNVTLLLGNFDPDGGQAAAAQDGLLITDPDGVNAIGTGFFAVPASNGTQVFVPQNFDFDLGIGVDLRNVLTANVVIDLQGGDDDLTFADDVDLIPVVTDYDVRGGDNGTNSDVLFLDGSTGVAETITIDDDSVETDRTDIFGYAGVTIEARGYEDISYVGEGFDDVLRVDLGAGTATARIQSASPSSTDEVISNVLPTVLFRQVDNFVVQASVDPTDITFVLNNLSGAVGYEYLSIGADLLTIEGSSGADEFTASLDATGDLQISDNAGHLITTGNTTPADVLRVETLAGDDTFTVDVGGTDLIDMPIFFDGGVGSDLLVVQGNPTPNVTSVTYTPGLQPDEGRLTYDADTPMTIDFDNLEPVVDLVPALSLFVNGTNANNAITYSLGSIGNRGLVSIDGFETIDFENKTNLEINALDGDDTIVADNDFVTTSLQSVIFNGDAGNDTIRFDNLPDAGATAFVGAAARGGSGDDVIDGSGINVNTPLTLVGDSGNDTLTGGAGIDGLNGGADDDIIIDSPGAGDGDIIDGGLSGNDTFIVRGTFLGETIGVFQEAPTNVANDFYTLDVLGPTVGTKRLIGTLGGATPDNPANRPNIERIVVEGLAGDDAIRAGHADEYSDLDGNNGAPSQTIAFEVRGGSPNASDRLIVPDDGLGDLVIQRQGADQRSGSVTVGGMAPIDYSEIEFVNVTPLDPISARYG